MREAYFTTIFCGIETTDPAALKSISKDHNMMVPIMEAIQTLNSYGIEIASGIILGLDTDKPDTVDHILQFAEESKIPLLTINLLQALPKTPLWDRLKREGRLVENDEDLESNVMFKLPYDDVVAMWRRAMGVAYEPGKVLSRYLHQCKTTYPNRIKVPNSPERASWKNIKRGLVIMRNIIWQLGIVGSYKRAFWSFAGPLLLRGRHRRHDGRRHRRPPCHRVFAGGIRGQGDRVLLLEQVAGGGCPGRMRRADHAITARILWPERTPQRQIRLQNEIFGLLCGPDRARSTPGSRRGRSVVRATLLLRRRDPFPLRPKPGTPGSISEPLDTDGKCSIRVRTRRRMSKPSGAP